MDRDLMILSAGQMVDLIKGEREQGFEVTIDLSGAPWTFSIGAYMS